MILLPYSNYVSGAAGNSGATANCMHPHISRWTAFTFSRTLPYDGRREDGAGAVMHLPQYEAQIEMSYMAKTAAQ